MEKPGSTESGLPVQTVPITPRIRESSIPMPITFYTLVSAKPSLDPGESMTNLG